MWTVDDTFSNVEMLIGVTIVTPIIYNELIAFISMLHKLSTFI